MKSKLIAIFYLFCAMGLTGFTEDYTSQCRDDSRIICRDQSSALSTYDQQNFSQSQQSQLSQRGGFQPSTPQNYQPVYSYLTFPLQSVPTPRPSYSSYGPDMNSFEQQRVAVDTVNQMNIATVTAPARDFSGAAPAEDPRELSRKIKEAAQGVTRSPAVGDDMMEQSRSAVAAIDQSQFSQPVTTPPDFSIYAPISGVDGLRDQSPKTKDAAQDFSTGQ